MENNWLPIGSIVKIEKAKVIVAGYQASNKEKKYFKYIGFIYPLGIYKKDEILFFNDDAINEVVFEGYKFQHYDDVINSLNESEKKLKEELGL